MKKNKLKAPNSQHKMNKSDKKYKYKTNEITSSTIANDHELKARIIHLLLIRQGLQEKSLIQMRSKKTKQRSDQNPKMHKERSQKNVKSWLDAKL